MKLRPAAFLAALVAIFVATLLALSGISQEREIESPTPSQGNALSASGFIDSIGVGVHFNYLDTAYARRAELLDLIDDLGVSHVRDGMPFRSEEFAQALREVAERDIGMTLLSDLDFVPDEAIADSIEAGGPQLEAVESPNELDNSGSGAWAADLNAYVPPLASAAADADLPLLGPTFVDADNYAVVEDLPFSVSNFHPYPGGEAPEEATLAPLNDADPGKPIVFTETGYHNALGSSEGQPGVPESVSAVYLPRLLLTAYANGVDRTFIYELVDEKPDPQGLDAEQNFGLLRQDLSPKPSFRSLETMIEILGRSSTEAYEAPDARVVSAAADEDEPETVLLEREDGSRVLAVWRPDSIWDTASQTPTPSESLRAEIRFSTPPSSVKVTTLDVPAVTREVEPRSRIELEITSRVSLIAFR